MKVMVFGSFDRLHDGHRALFRQAKELSDGGTVVVVVARDSSIRRLKHREPRLPEIDRLAEVAIEPLVDEAMLGDSDDFFKVIIQVRPDIILLGYDQTTFTEEELYRALQERGLHSHIIRGEPFKPEVYKSTKLNPGRAVR